METKNREKLLMIAIGALAALWLLNLLVFGPLIDSWHGRSSEIVKLKKEIANGAMLVRRESTIQDRWDNMRANALASNPTVAERQLFTAFDHWVSAGRVVEGSFRPQVQDSDTNFTTVDCRSDVSGSLETVKDFLKAMSKDPLADKVESFELTSKDDNGQQLALGLSLSGLILADSDPSSFPPSPSPMATAQTTNMAANSESDPFQMIARNNIFDQSRVYRDYTAKITRPVVRPEIITFCGTAINYGVGSAWFQGSGVRDGREYKVGDSLGESGLKIAQIINTETVKLTNSTSNTFTLSTEGNASLRRMGTGPWQLSGYIAAASTPDSSSKESTSSAPASSAGASDVLARLLKRRQEEEK